MDAYLWPDFQKHQWEAQMEVIYIKICYSHKLLNSNDSLLTFALPLLSCNLQFRQSLGLCALCGNHIFLKRSNF